MMLPAILPQKHTQPVQQPHQLLPHSLPVVDPYEPVLQPNNPNSPIHLDCEPNDSSPNLSGNPHFFQMFYPQLSEMFNTACSILTTPIPSNNSPIFLPNTVSNYEIDCDDRKPFKVENLCFPHHSVPASIVMAPTHLRQLFFLAVTQYLVWFVCLGCGLGFALLLISPQRLSTSLRHLLGPWVGMGSGYQH